MLFFHLGDSTLNAGALFGAHKASVCAKGAIRSVVKPVCRMPERLKDLNTFFKEKRENRITWNANEFRRELAKWEVQWIHSRNALPTYAEDMSIYDKLLELQNYPLDSKDIAAIEGAK